MKRVILTSIATLICILAAGAQDIGEGVKVRAFRTERNGGYLSVDMIVDIDSLQVKSRRAVLLTPLIVKEMQSAKMPSVAIYGRRRYFSYLRNEGDRMLSGLDEIRLRAGKHQPSKVNYHTVIIFEDWMDGATVVMNRSDYNCCKRVASVERAALGGSTDNFYPELIYAAPVAAQPKWRTVGGRADIAFPASLTTIDTDFGSNRAELKRISDLIERLANDGDVKIESIWIKGFASPDGRYDNNMKIARERTQAVKDYIESLYSSRGVKMITEYEPEDWEGLRAAVMKTDIDHRDDILEIIDNNRDFDTKEWMIRSRYPESYNYLHDVIYPTLRHTDYSITYLVRPYDDPQEILDIMRTSPDNLNLHEFFIAASSLERGSAEEAQLWETAARVCPDDETANLNAACAFMRRGDNKAAEVYLSKAGDSPEALYARGVYALRTGNRDEAIDRFKAAKDAGLPQAASILADLGIK